MKKLIDFLRAETGATAIEYGLIAALVTVVIIVSLQFVGSQLGITYQTWSAAVGAANN